MTFTHATPPSVIAFVIIVLAVLAQIMMGLHLAARINGQDGRRVSLTALGLILFWVFTLMTLSMSGFLEKKPIPGIPLFFALTFMGAATFAFSPYGKLLLSLPVQLLVLFQAFRFPLELVLHSWVQQGTIPETMTWTGQNMDIISGVAALILGFFAHRSHKIAWTANIIGIVLLLNVIRVAVMSSPVPFGWQVEPPLQLAFYFPYLLIAPLCVGSALAGHILLTRKLLMK